MMKDVENVLSPRINASFEVIPQKVFLKAGYGVTAKMPTLVYLYPEKAYFEYININEMPNDKIPEDQCIFMTTTRVFDTRNHDLKAATNTKAELGADFLFDDFQLYVTAFKEHLKKPLHRLQFPEGPCRNKIGSAGHPAPPPADASTSRLPMPSTQIGRASCRERV